jgi:N6-adenosine-specific RNA methylase IME4
VSDAGRLLPSAEPHNSRPDRLRREAAAVKYSIIYADPPWDHVSWKNGSRRPSLHYPVMSLDEIKQLPIREISSPDCWLFLWTTYPHIPEALEVIAAWGFTYKTVAFTWVKRNKKKQTWFMGCGSYTRANAEICLLGKKGNIRRVSAGVHSIIDSPVSEHSRKPEQAKQRIVELCGDLPRIELFARRQSEGWSAFGNEVEDSIALPPARRPAKQSADPHRR